ncbi:hypothetical protein EB796_018505 [Bugula neritina]|uniref:MARVEL domain-containing protein n=1 Tax=Bugula neritina TaxID=10212 RepID=A0A7J7JAB5_BUGNE|nr:hypothetical protein EB796_018505 [Bugula neritina]
MRRLSDKYHSFKMMEESTDKYSAPPPNYDDAAGGTYTHTHTEHTTHTATLGLNKDYIRTIPGILKLAEIATSLICFIVALVATSGASGWCGFVAGIVFFISLVWFFLNLFGVIQKIHPVRILIEWIYYLVLTICFCIASIVAAVYAARSFPAMGVYAFFGFVCTAALAVDLFFQFKVWRSQGVSSHSQTTTTVTSSTAGTHATTEVRY